jgi:hypothetical protein
MCANTCFRWQSGLQSLPLLLALPPSGCMRGTEDHDNCYRAKAGRVDGLQGRLHCRASLWFVPHVCVCACRCTLQSGTRRHQSSWAAGLWWASPCAWIGASITLRQKKTGACQPKYTCATDSTPHVVEFRALVRCRILPLVNPRHMTSRHNHSRVPYQAGSCWACNATALQPRACLWRARRSHITDMRGNSATFAQSTPLTCV